MDARKKFILYKSYKNVSFWKWTLNSKETKSGKLLDEEKNILRNTASKYLEQILTKLKVERNNILRIDGGLDNLFLIINRIFTRENKLSMDSSNGNN